MSKKVKNWKAAKCVISAEGWKKWIKLTKYEMIRLSINDLVNERIFKLITIDMQIMTIWCLLMIECVSDDKLWYC